LLDSSLAVRATTAAVRASILFSSDIEFLQRVTVYRGLNCEAVFNERLDDFTMHLTRGSD
jgi:hypothetical protein